MNKSGVAQSTITAIESAIRAYAMPCGCGRTTKCVTLRCPCRLEGTSCFDDCNCTESCCENRGLGTSGVHRGSSGVSFVAAGAAGVLVSDAVLSRRDLDARPAAAAAAASTASPRGLGCECGFTVKCVTSRCVCHRASVPCGSACRCSSAKCENRARLGGGISSGGRGGGGRVSGSPRAPGSDEDDANDHLRGAVTHLADAVWHARGRDVYTLSNRRPGHENVDHILEIQVVQKAYEALPAAFSTRSVRSAVSSAVKGAVNCETNLNVTSSAINQAKRGPFTSFLHRLDERRSLPVAQFARTSCPALVEDGTWARIEANVVTAHERVVATLEDAPRSAALESFVDELARVVARMGLV